MTTLSVLASKLGISIPYACIGKESNSLENVDAGLVHSEKNAYTEYIDPKRDEWTTKDSTTAEKNRSSPFLSKRAETDCRDGN